MNFPTLFVGFLVIVAVALVIRSIVQGKKSGKHTCSGNCASCSCHTKKP